MNRNIFKILFVVLVTIYLIHPSVKATSPACAKLHTDYTFFFPTKLPAGVALQPKSFLGIYTLVNTSSTELYIGKTYPTEQEKLDWVYRWDEEEISHPDSFPKNFHVSTMLKNGQVYGMERGLLTQKPFPINLDRGALSFYSSGVIQSLDTCGAPMKFPFPNVEYFTMPLYYGNTHVVLTGLLIGVPFYTPYLAEVLTIVLLIALVRVVMKQRTRKK